MMPTQASPVRVRREDSGNREDARNEHDRLSIRERGRETETKGAPAELAIRLARLGCRRLLAGRSAAVDETRPEIDEIRSAEEMYREAKPGKCIEDDGHPEQCAKREQHDAEHVAGDCVCQVG